MDRYSRSRSARSVGSDLCKLFQKEQCIEISLTTDHVSQAVSPLDICTRTKTIERATKSPHCRCPSPSATPTKWRRKRSTWPRTTLRLSLSPVHRPAGIIWRSPLHIGPCVERAARSRRVQDPEGGQVRRRRLRRATSLGGRGGQREAPSRLGRPSRGRHQREERGGQGAPPGRCRPKLAGRVHQHIQHG